MSVDLILFYISQYWNYSLVMLVILSITPYLLKTANSYEDRKAIIAIVAIIFIVLFGALGTFIKPYFTNTKEYNFQYGDDSYHLGGTGTFVNKSDVMTNAHVVDGCKKLAIRANDRTYSGKIISILKRGEGDIAFIRTNAKRKRYALISNKDLEINDLLIFPNYTSKPGKFSKAKAKVSDLFPQAKESSIIALSPKTRKGNSGSPLYNDKGYLIGNVHSSSLSLFSSHLVASSLKRIKELAQRSGVELMSGKNENRDLTKMDYFFKDYGVGILCSNKT